MIGRLATVLVCLALSVPALAQHHAQLASEPRSKTISAAANVKKAVAASARRAKPQASKPRSLARAKRPPSKATKAVELRGPRARRGYAKVSELVNFPSFFPGIGTLYVKPKTLPHGPFLAFDRSDRLVSTIYMVPMQDMEDRKLIEALAGFAGRGDHVSLHYNNGHPGVDIPHYHFVIWHVSKKEEARVAK